MVNTYLIVAGMAYLLGSIPFGYILVKLFLKQDIRRTGSGNIGATNVARSGAKGLAIATLVLDAAKGFAAVGLGFAYCDKFSPPAAVFIPHFGTTVAGRPDCFGALGVAALFAILGHCFPIWLNFKGGKGVATALGAFAGLAPKSVVVALAVFLITLALTRYVSLGSILAALIFPIATAYFYPQMNTLSMGALMMAASGIIIAKHHQNIRRLLRGTEHKFGTPKTPTDPIQAEKNA